MLSYLRNLSLSIKFSVAVGILLLLFCGLFSSVLYFYLRAQVIEEAREKTAIIMTQVRSIGLYVRDTLRPTIFAELARLNAKDAFIIEAMSTTHVSMQVMRRFNSEMQDYRYQRVSDNPINPSHKADSFHAGMISHFRNRKDQGQWDGIVDIDGRTYMVQLRTIVMQENCLLCHGDPANAPPQLVKKYGTQSGFRWQVNDVVGVDSVKVPLDVAIARVKKVALDTFLFGSATLCLLFLTLYGIFRQLVSKPLNDLSDTFKAIAGGQEPLGKDIPSIREDEIGDLTRSFNVLSRHLLDAQERLKSAAEIEKKMLQTEKLAALGQLSAGVAHEINNPLGGVKLCFNNLIATDMDNKTRDEHIKVINAGFDRIQNIVKQLLDFSKNAPVTLSPASINALLENILGLTEYTIARKGIVVSKDFAADLPDIMVDGNKIEQVFLNLIINAAQSMDSSGTLAIRTFREDDLCKIAFSDTGRGIPKEVLSRIFDPFFSTKEVGEGTGLGLTVSKAIIEQHKGTIRVETSEKGSTFTVELPVRT